MTNLIYNSMTFNVVYVDPTISSAGNGSSPATALKDLPTTLVNKTCYIIRRTAETSFVNLPQTNNSGLTHIMIIGMPKSDSQLYPLLAEEVTSAWSADEAKYANVRCNINSYTTTVTSSSVFYEKNIELFVSEYCYYYRDGESGSANSNFSPIFYNNDETIKANYIFKNCKFGYTQYDLDNDAYLSSNTDVSTDTSKYPQKKCGGYFLIYTANSMTFDNCIFNWVSTNYNNSNYEYRNYNTSIKVTKYVKTLNLFNCMINRLCRENIAEGVESLNSAIYIDKSTDGSYNNGQIVNEINIKNMTINYILSTINSKLGSTRCIYCNYGNVVDLENITVNFKYMKDYDINVNGLTSSNLTGIIFINNVLNNLKIKNFTCDNTKDSKTKMDGFPLLEVNTFNVYQAGTPSYIKDINIKFSNEPNIYQFNSTYIVKLYGDENRRFGTNGESLSGSGNWISGTTYRGNLIENINIDAQQFTNYALDLQKVAVKTNTLKCRTRMIGSTMEVNSYYNNLSYMTGIDMSNNSYLKCNDYQANIENFNGTPQIGFDMFGAAYVGKTNCILYSENPITNNPMTTYNMQLTCPNYISTGQFFARNGYAYAKSWTVARTGSTASASLKLSNNYQQKYAYPLIIGMTPYKGIELVPSTTGKHKVTCYVATKMLTENELVSLNQNCWLEIRVPKTQEDGNVLYTVYNTKGNCWYNDESTWSNDVELKSFKIETEIDVNEATTPIEIKIGYCQYSSNGYVYIDPDIKLAQVA